MTHAEGGGLLGGQTDQAKVCQQMSVLSATDPATTRVPSCRLAAATGQLAVLVGAPQAGGSTGFLTPLAASPDPFWELL